MAAHKARKRIPILSLSFRVVATVFCVLLLLSYLSALIDPGVFPIAGFFGLYFIPVLAFNVLLLVIALLRWSSSAWIPVIAILPSLFFTGFFFRSGDRNALPESVASATDGITLMTWNVGGFRSSSDGDAGSAMDDVAGLIGTQNPDVVSLQEFRIENPGQIRSMFPQYPYIRNHFYRLRNGDYVGNVTLSRLPVGEEGSLPFAGTTNMVLYTDVQYGSGVFRLYNVHLESNNISLTSLIKDVRGGYDEFSQEFVEAHEKVKKSSSRRGSQVRALLGNISECGLPAVICGDVNDTPMSYCFRTLYEGRKDTFCEAGKGFGATYRVLWPLLRIDYVFVPEDSEVLFHRTPRVESSDHYPVIVKVHM